MISEFNVKRARGETILIAEIVSEKDGFAAFHKERHVMTEIQSQRLSSLVTEILNENNASKRE